MIYLIMTNPALLALILVLCGSLSILSVILYTTRNTAENINRASFVEAPQTKQNYDHEETTITALLL